MKVSSLVILTLVAILALGGCHTRSLTRDEAKHLIASSETFTARAKREILLGPDMRRGMGDFLNSLTGTFDFELAECLGADRDPIAGPGILAKKNGEVVLTDKGKEAAKDWVVDPERPNGHFVPVAQPELLEVSGIVQAEGGTDAEVRFKWRWKWTSLIARLDFGDWAGCTPNAMIKTLGYDSTAQQFTVRDGTAVLRRYDDGWRVETIATQQLLAVAHASVPDQPPSKKVSPPNIEVITGIVAEPDVLLSDEGLRVGLGGNQDGGSRFYGFGHNGEIAWDLRVGDRIQVVGIPFPLVEETRGSFPRAPFVKHEPTHGVLADKITIVSRNK